MTSDSLAALAGQVLIVGFPAGPLPDNLAGLAGRDAVGGFILFRRNLVAGGSVGAAPLERAAEQLSLDQIAAQHAALIGACSGSVPPIIAIDQEGGRVARLKAPVLELPPMRVLGALDDTELTFRAGRTLGRQLKALGVSLDFAPVLDVDSNPANPVIGDRSFGPDPERVARHGASFARGLQAAGVAACGKHFPGHGDTALDSHLALPRVQHALDRLNAIELLPFARAHEACASIMTAHVVFDAIDPDRPATLSPAALSILRERIGYRGVIVSDDLEMRAIADHHGVGESACAAITSGCDALLVCSKPELALEAHGALLERAAGDATFRARLEDAARRCHGLRETYRAEPLPAQRVTELFSEGALHDEALALGEQLAHARAAHA
jgi:beta-N-acetylhexosaminidase